MKIKWDIVLWVVAAISFILMVSTYYKNNKLEKAASNVCDRIYELNSNLPEQTEKRESNYLSPYNKLFESNEDMIAWINIPGTIIDYPIMQKQDDNEYYLYRNFFGEDDKNGTLFLDTRCDIDSDNCNLIVHGHHMKSGAMFGSLPKFLNEDYKNEHPEIIIYTKSEKRVYKIIAAFASKIYKNNTEEFKYYEYTNLKDSVVLDSFYNGIMKMNIYEECKLISDYNEYITLSTCSYHTKDGRMAVVGKRIQ